MKKTGMLRMLFLLLCVGTFVGLQHPIHWQVFLTQEEFTESSKEIWNANRGFYHIYGLLLSDEPKNMGEWLDGQLEKNTNHALAMIQINLREYSQTEISADGIQNLQQLFEALSKTRERWIVRFLYDWNGKNEQYEPHNIDIVLHHMQQVGEILRMYQNAIFTVQGLFVGNWGEIHGTKFADTQSLQRLAAQLAHVTDEKTYLAVRTPVQWRRIIHTAEHCLADRFGLFNDGMLSSANDSGTYGDKTAKEAGWEHAWTRAEELKFQEELCVRVPNGGEVILDNVYNDLEHAIADFKTMHVTYLNEDYDKDVLEKWESVRVRTKDCFDGETGLSYIRSHLGYRLLLTEIALEHDVWRDSVLVEISLKNVGFAPIYHDCEAVVCVKDALGNIVYEQMADGDVTALTGGNQAQRQETFFAQIPLRDFKRGCYSVYFAVQSVEEKEMVTFANEQEQEREGYQIGTIQMQQ